MTEQQYTLNIMKMDNEYSMRLDGEQTPSIMGSLEEIQDAFNRRIESIAQSIKDVDVKIDFNINKFFDKLGLDKPVCSYVNANITVDGKTVYVGFSNRPKFVFNVTWFNYTGVHLTRTVICESTLPSESKDSGRQIVLEVDGIARISLTSKTFERRV